MKEGMLDTLLVYLRRLIDTDDRSLSLGMILRLLFEPDAIQALRERSKTVLGTKALDDRTFDARVDILKILCGMHLAPDGAINDPLVARVGTQARLVYRAANKRAAHITRDDYSVGLDDLHQLISNAIGIARVISHILGDDAGEFDYNELDHAAYEASKQVFGCSHAGGLITADPLSRKAAM